MPITYQYDPSTNLVSATASGVLKASELEAYLNQVLEDTTIQPGYVEYVDFSAISDLQLSYNETAKFSSIWASYVAKGCSRTIIYAPSDIAYGVFRMIKTVISLRLDDKLASFHIVRTEREALHLIKRG
jgi:hypothetical protein